MPPPTVPARSSRSTAGTFSAACEVGTMAKKFHDTSSDALAGLLFDGMTIAAGGFGLCGIPETLIDEIRRRGVKDLPVISHNAGLDDRSEEHTSELPSLMRISSAAFRLKQNKHTK